MVDSYVKIESNRLKYLREYLSDLHVARYQGLADYLNNRADMSEFTIGNVYILLSSFIGSPRAMKQAYQDAMCICGKFGKPTYFITMTCKPKWKEIIDNLLPGQTASDRPDLVGRVFQLKLKELIEDIQKRQVLGVVVARIHVIEFQHGLRHCHMLLWVSPEDVPKTPEAMDVTISAEIPDKETEPRLHSIVMSNTIHGPCGKYINKDSPCMNGDVCTKSFPKDFVAPTDINTNGYPIYRRKNTGSTVTLKRGNKEYQVDNRWTVPYNRYLLLKFDCHINVEFCASITSVKYIFKYVHT